MNKNGLIHSLLILFNIEFVYFIAKKAKYISELKTNLLGKEECLRPLIFDPPDLRLLAGNLLPSPPAQVSIIIRLTPAYIYMYNVQYRFLLVFK